MLSDAIMDVLFLILVVLRVAETNRPQIETMNRVIMNQKLTIPCTIKMNSNAGLLEWLFKPFNATDYNLLCRKQPDGNECIKNNKTEHWRENVQMSTDSIEIERVAQHHSGTYQCKYMDSSTLDRLMIIVNVLTPPGKPKIHTSPTILVEDNIVILTCESTGGNPAPSLKWVWKDFSNKPIPKRNILNQTLLPSDAVYGQTVLTVLWMPKSFDDGNSISCFAENQVAEVSSNWMYLNVHYPPIIFDFPPSPYFALLGSEINIECKATLKTTTRVKWWSNTGVIVADTPQLIIKSISKVHNGSYRCSVTNPFGTSSATVNITVLSSPVIDLVKNLIINEGDVLTVHCNVIPVYSNVTWWINSQCISTNNSLAIKLEEVKPVEVQCRASVLLNKFPGHHVLASSKSSVNVTIQYKPRQPSIAAHPIGHLMIGMDATITCVPDLKEPGLPKPDYFWQKLNSKWNKNNTNFLSFSSLEFADSGMYICNLFNSIGQSKERSYDLVIYGQPVKVEPSIQSPSLVNVKEGKPFSIVCHFQAYPAPEISWFNDDILISYAMNISGYRLEHKQTSINGFKSILHVDRLLTKPNEMYRCLATNKYGTLHHDYSIHILYPPKLVDDMFMVAADSSGLTITKIPVYLNCTISGSPTISIVWFRKLPNNNEHSIENSTERYYIKETFYANIMESILYVRNFQNEDYGRYFCMARNSEGQLETELEIRKLSIPDPSHDLILSKQSWDSLTFKWIPGFDGGYPQIFLVSYITDMQLSPTQLKTDKPNITLTDLLPDTSYTVTVASSNKLGITQATLSAKVKTEALTIGEERILTVIKDEQAIELRLPSNLSTNIFCVTVEEMENGASLTGSWIILKRCVRDVYNRVAVENTLAKFRVRICLINLPDVCSSPITNRVLPDATETSLSTRLIGTVAAACTVLVIVLAILLFFILIRTRRLLPGITDLKDIKRNRKSSRDNFSNYISKPLTSLCPNKHGILVDGGGCPLLNTYSCDQNTLSNAPIEIFNVCSSHNIFNEGLYSTLVKSSSFNMFSNDVFSTPVVNDAPFIDQSSCYCHNDQLMFGTIPVTDNKTRNEKIFYEVMV